MWKILIDLVKGTMALIFYGRMELLIVLSQRQTQLRLKWPDKAR